MDEAADVFLDEASVVEASVVTGWSGTGQGWGVAGVPVSGGGGDLDPVTSPCWSGCRCGSPTGGLFGVVAGLAQPLPVRRRGPAAVFDRHDVVGVPDRGPAQRGTAGPVPHR